MMLAWAHVALVALSVAAGVLCLVLGFAGRGPNDWTVGALAVLEAALVATGVVAIVAGIAGPAPAAGGEQDTVAAGIEYAGYVLTALIIPPAAVLWGLVERSRWSTVVFGAAALTVAVMGVRMQQIWFPAEPWLVGGPVLAGGSVGW